MNARRFGGGAFGSARWSWQRGLTVPSSRSSHVSEAAPQNTQGREVINCMGALRACNAQRRPWLRLDWESQWRSCQVVSALGVQLSAAEGTSALGAGSPMGCFQRTDAHALTFDFAIFHRVVVARNFNACGRAATSLWNLFLQWRLSRFGATLLDGSSIFPRRHFFYSQSRIQTGRL